MFEEAKSRELDIRRKKGRKKKRRSRSTDFRTLEVAGSEGRNNTDDHLSN